MTIFADNIQSGLIAATSSEASYAPTMLCRTVKLGGSGTKSLKLPAGVENLDGTLYITTNGSAATSDSITVSANGTNYLTFSSVGSAGGILRVTTTGLGVLTAVGSACASLSTTAEVSANVTLASVDQAATYQLNLMFNRVRTQVD